MRIGSFIQRFFHLKRRSVLAGGPGQGPSEAPVPKTRRRLFTKYVALFVAVVCVALLSNGIFDVFFYYREHKTSLVQIQREQAEAAAAKISQFLRQPPRFHRVLAAVRRALRSLPCKPCSPRNSARCRANSS